MRKLLAIFILIATLVGCNKQHEGLDVVVGGPVPTPISVAIDDTRAEAGKDSAKSVFENGILGRDVTMRYILQVYIDGQAATRCVQYSDTTSVEFRPLLVPNRNYKFVVWADVVTKDSGVEDWSNVGDNHYNTDDLENITLLGDWNAMDESRDAFTGITIKNNFECNGPVTISLTRPFAKLRIVATDKANATTLPVKGMMEYTTSHRVAFNAVEGTAAAASLEKKTHTYSIDTYSNDANSVSDLTLFSDYFFSENDTISLKFTIYADNAMSTPIGKEYIIDKIVVKRNSLTTIKGEILTGGVVRISVDGYDYVLAGTGELMD